MPLAAGQSTGFKAFTTGFTPKVIAIYNNTPATIYFANGTYGSYAAMPGNVTSIPANTYGIIPYTANAQAFTLFWQSSSALSQNYTIVVQWSDEDIPLKSFPLVQSVQGNVNISGVQAGVIFAVAQSGSWTIQSIADTVTIQGTGTGGAVAVSQNGSWTVAASQSGSWSVSAVQSGTWNIGSITDTVTIQGTGSGGALAVSQEGSWTIAASQSGNWSVSAVQSGTWNIGSINNTVNIQGVNGGTAIGVSLGSEVINVQQASGGNFQVSFASAQQVTLAATGPVEIQNLNINTNQLVLLHQAKVSITNLSNGSNFTVSGDTNSTGIYPHAQLGLYDGLIIQIYSSGGYEYYLDTGPFCVMTSAASGVSEYNTPPTVWNYIFPLLPTYAGFVGVGSIILYIEEPFMANVVNTVWLNQTGGTIAADTVTVTIWGIKAQVQVQGTPSVNSTIKNNVVPGNELVFIGQQANTFDNWANDTFQTFTVSSTTIGLFDGFVIVISSPSSAATFSTNGAALSLYVNGSPDNIGPINQFVDVWDETGLPESKWSNVGANGSNGVFGPLLFAAPHMFNELQMTIKNTTGSTLSAITLTFSLFGIRAQVQINNPSGSPVNTSVGNTVATNSNVTNSTTSPANFQPGEGSFDSKLGLSTTSVGAGTSSSIFSSGNYMKEINITLLCSASDTVNIKDGSGNILRTVLLTANAQSFVDLSFGEGVANNGITLDNTGGSQAVTLSGYMVTTSSTPPSRVGSIV